MKSDNPTTPVLPIASGHGLPPCGNGQCTPPCDSPDADEAEAFFQELQAIWDEQGRRIDQILSEHPLSCSYSAIPFRRRRRLTATYLVLILVNLACAAYALVVFSAATYPLRPVTLFVALVCVFAALHSLCVLLNHRHSLGRISLGKELQQLNIMNRLAPKSINSCPFWQAVSTAFSSAREVAAVNAVAIIVLASLTCSPLGDGYAMTLTGRDSRAALTHNIDQMIAQL